MAKIVEQEFKGRCAVVTGGGRGIGKAVCLDLAGAGAFVHIVSQSQNALATANEINWAGGRACGHVGSVADEDFCIRVVEAAKRDGGPDIIVNAAGIVGDTGKFSTLSMRRFAESLGVNLMGTCHFMHAALPLMEARGFGRIINFGGGGAAYSYPNFTPYGTSKAALVRLTETVADEITTPNVTVNIIAPGAVATDMLAQVRAAGGEVRTVTDVKEPVKLIHFLCSDRAGHINGRFIHARDNYQDASLFDSKDMLKLRRVERR